MARLERIAPEIPVRDLQASLNYYAVKLAFAVVSEWPDGKYAIVQRDDVAIHLFEQGAQTQPVGVHIFTRGIDELHDELKASGVVITQAIERKPWGNRDFRIIDPSGNEIKFTEPFAG
jgi:predicted enzyme related to lactoylglutathione lyase